MIAFPPHTRQLLVRRVPPLWGDPSYVACARGTRMAYRCLGNPHGELWLVLHGGPGSGSHPGLLQAFDLNMHRVIVPDQRGAGLSWPRAAVAGNHTEQLVADLEQLRVQLAIERWNVSAGSWGTVLALLYAQKYPHRVQRLVLRGAFRATRAEIGALLQPGSGADPAVCLLPGMVCNVRSRYPQFLAQLEQVLQVGAPRVATLQALRCWNVLEQGAALHGMWRSLVHASESPQRDWIPTLRRQWAQLQRQRRRAIAQFHRTGISRADRRDWQKFRIQVHYLRHLAFLRAGDLDRAVRSVASHGIPSDWVHGRYDAVCPPHNSGRWLAQMRDIHPGLACGHTPLAGHLGSEPGLNATLTRIVRHRRTRNPPI